EMPSILSPRPTIMLDVISLLVLGQLSLIILAGVKADCDDVKIRARVKRHPFHRAGETVKDLIAKHRALVVNKCEDNRTAVVEIRSKFDRSTVLILEFRVERQLRT